MSYHTSETYRDAGGVLGHGTGDFDPARRVGKLILMYAPPNQGGGLEDRFLGDTFYQGDIAYRSGNWGQPADWYKYRLKHAPGPDDRASVLARLEARISGAMPPAPGDMLDLVRAATTVHDDGATSGPGWTGTRFSFRVTIPKDQQQPPHYLEAMTGTLDVDQGGRVRHLTVTRDYRPLQAGKRAFPQVYTDDFSFSGFGEPVSVSAPPASEIFGPELTLTEP